jgi:hypothetical protein
MCGTACRHATAVPAFPGRHGHALLLETVKKPTSSAACGVLWPVFQLADQQTGHVAIHVRHMQAKFPALYKSIQV